MAVNAALARARAPTGEGPAAHTGAACVLLINSRLNRAVAGTSLASYLDDGSSHPVFHQGSDIDGEFIQSGSRQTG